MGGMSCVECHGAAHDRIGYELRMEDYGQGGHLSAAPQQL